MKKFIIALLLTAVLPFSAKTYGQFVKPLAIDITARGGYNFLENAPLAGGSVTLQIFNIRAEMELGWAQFTLPNVSKGNLCYFSTMVGYSYEFNHSVYAMIGITNWGNAELDFQKHDLYNVRSDIRGKVKVGCNLYMTQRLFFNIEMSYIWPPLSPPGDFCYRYSGLAITAGLGVRL